MISSITPIQLATIIHADHKIDAPELSISHVGIDSRKLLDGKTTVFFSLRGGQWDGHDFLNNCYRSGVRNFVIAADRAPVSGGDDFEACNFFVVPDTLIALQALAAWNRAQFKGPVVGITGSNGKTIVKEWLGQLLSTAFLTAKSPKSFNSQLGVPLSIFSIAPYHQVAVLEAGISLPGEMERLEKMIRPSVGILTNIGTAHSQHFTGESQKLEEKLTLFNQTDYLIYRKEQGLVAATVERVFPKERLVSWSENLDSDYHLRVKKQAGGSRIFLVKPDLSIRTFHTPFTDEASLENLRHAIVAASVLGMDPQTIELGVQQLRPVDMRLTSKSGRRNCTLIDDTYNNDLAGLEIALDFMQSQRRKKRRILVLSDFPQIKHSEKVYNRVVQLLNHYQVDQLIGIGPAIGSSVAESEVSADFFDSTEEFLASDLIHSFEDAVILIKGGRTFGFERIVHALEEQVHGTVLEINLNALTHNFHFYKQKLPPTTKLMAMVKAAAYGGGATEIANHLQKLKVDYLSVAYSDEGAQLREKGITLPIMVLNVSADNLPQIIQYRLEPVIYSPRILRIFGEHAQNVQETIAIHLDIDSGMRRLGFEPSEVGELTDLLKSYPNLRVQSIFTHLTSTDNAEHDPFTLRQLEVFQEFTAEFTQRLGYRPLVHALNTAGILRFPDHSFDMVRLGIGLYGISVDHLSADKLQQVGTLKTTISQIKELKKDDRIGYNRAGIMPDHGKIATIGLGYADGFDRRFSNGRGYVLINGQKAPVIGNVCMDMTMVNITGIDAKEGDEAIVFGEGIDLPKLASHIGTIPYELLTGISSRVKRVYFLD
ncbi:UDP-N-acetylmuramoylalanyl-D-glutamyl-2,6- diaminopimelate--D-alanyl-D-alanine ligase [Lunatimonas lonarensis]|uniref:Alanine racemase n=1 Tax=Lunatimonas lonarensis TaxID=1232681 RepID=R7ZWN3_9BACT|nr:bifunctional UDP-N-acetylmuramoyl-tripeptide:D-alanyl-D-alanine ligase/alanine racemase [Lunatimonas lonarensis]EON78419.1 UDP-N-acetylmuramoylalanyl-D-glutamyl-2,6- diaminopimelate--D-alanyl-D-alanine ligase [Lunatimonas lonarensis]